MGSQSLGLLPDQVSNTGLAEVPAEVLAEDSRRMEHFVVEGHPHRSHKADDHNQAARLATSKLQGEPRNRDEP